MNSQSMTTGRNAIRMAVWMCYLTVFAAKSCLAIDFLHDPFGVNVAVSPTIDKNMALAGVCGGLTLPTVLTMAEAVSRSLCNNPQTAQSWAGVKAQAASVGSAQAAYLPHLNASANVAKVANRITIPDYPAASSALSARSSDVNLSLNWVLYDFGLRAANLESARQLLNAAVAAQDDALQTVFLSTATSFNAAQAAQAGLLAAQDAEQAAAQSYRAAQAKYVAGAGSLADKLLAQTASASAVVQRVRADGDWQTALGGLASVMGLRPDTPLQLADIGMEAEDVGPAPVFEKAVGELIEAALSVHPKIIAARARLQSAQAQEEAAQAQGKPTLSLYMTGDRSDTPINQVASRQINNSRSIGLQINIPLLDGISRNYQARGAQAGVESAAAELAETQRVVALEVWNSAKSLHTETESAKATLILIQSAQQSMVVAQGRYKAGVGTMLELLKAQSELAAAGQQRIIALTRGQTARLRLAASLARLRMDVL